jgi:hypothetical protein
MWSCHLFVGCHFGVEWYEADKIDPYYEDSRTSKFNYFIIDLGCLRIQRCEKLENV